MDATKLSLCLIFLKLCTFSKQTEDFGKERNSALLTDYDSEGSGEVKWEVIEGSAEEKTKMLSEYIPCPAQTDDRNITWPETFPGLTATKNCSTGYIGLVSRKCRLDGYKGTWMKPSHIICTRVKIAEIQNKLNIIKQGVEVEKLVNVIREFKNESKEIIQTKFSASDVRSAVQVLATVSDIVMNREEGITVEETVEFFQATDVVLSDRNEESWNNLNDETGVNSAAIVMDIVSNVSDTVLKTLPVDQSISVVGDNIVLQIENTNIRSIVFPTKISSEIKSAVFFSKETIQNSLNVSDNVRYYAAYYKTLGKFLPERSMMEEIGSPILAFSIPKADILKKLDPPVQIKFEIKKTNLTGRLCSYWNTNGGVWSVDGCRTSFVNETFTECQCDHLTNFAVLISVEEIDKEHHEIMSTMSVIGFIISNVCLMMTIFIYIYLWRHLKSDKAAVLMLLCITLIVAYFTYMFGVERTENKDICTGVAVSLHYLFLVVICLMASEGIIHAVLVVAVFKQRQSINRFLIPISFGVPLLIVVISGSITKLKGYGTDKFCWLTTDNGLIYSFFGPCAAVILVNIVITCLLLKKLFSTRAAMNKTKKEKIKTGVRSLLILAPMFGLTWLFGLFSIDGDTVVFAYLFVVCNSLQGALIFLMHTLMNPTVKKEMNKSFKRFRSQKDLATSTTSWSSESFPTLNIFKKFRNKGSTDTSVPTNDVELVSFVSHKRNEVTKTEESSAMMVNAST